MADFILLSPGEAEPKQAPVASSNGFRLLDPSPVDEAVKNIRATSDIKSPQAIQAIKASRDTGLSTNVTLADPQSVQLRQMERGMRAALTDAPKTASLMSGDPMRAAAVKEDYESLSLLERLLQGGNPMIDNEFNFAEDTGFGGSLGSAAKQISRTVPSFAKSTNEILAMGAGALDSAERGLGNVLGTGSTGVFGSARDWLLGQSEWINQNIMQDPSLMLPKDKQGQLLKSEGGWSYSWDRPELLLDPEWLTFNTGEVASSMAPMLAATFATGGSTMVGALVGSGQEAGDLYRELIMDGNDPDKALTAATLFGVGVGWLNKVGLDKMLDKTVATTLFKRAAKSLTAGTVEGITEYLEEPLQALMKGWAEQKSFPEIAADVQASLANIDVIPGSILFGGGVSYSTHYRAEYQRARFSESEQKFLDQIDQAAATPQMAQHDPLLYQETLRVLKDGGKVTHVYIPAQALGSLYSGEGLSKIVDSLGVREQYGDMAEVGGDLKVEIGDYIKTVAADPNFAPTVVNDRRLSEDGFTRNELATMQKEQAQEFQSVLEAVKSEREAESAIEAEGQQIYKQVVEMRRASGMVPMSVREDAAAMAAFFTIVAKRTDGQSTPMQLFERFGPSEVRGAPMAQTGELRQDHPAMAGVDMNDAAQVAEAQRLWAEMGTESPYFKKWSGDAPIIKTGDVYAGGAVVVDGFHGSPSPAMRAKDAAFSLSSSGDRTDFGNFGTGVYLSPQEFIGKAYAGATGINIHAYLALKNPLVFSVVGPEYTASVEAKARELGVTENAIWENGGQRNKAWSDQFRERAVSAGYDGVVTVNADGTLGAEVVAFDPAQIKSVFNRGTFDASDPRILMQTAESTGATPDARAEYFKNSKVRDENGNLKALFHGAKRADRIDEAEKFAKDRATSGPMAFFTDDPEIASGYASNKQDTSLEVESLEPFFVVNGKKDFKTAWYSIDPLKRYKIKEMAHRIGQNEETDAIEIVMRDGDKNAGLAGRQHFEYELKQAGGNAIKALYEMWVNSGAIFGEERRFVEVLRVAGIEDAVFNDPYAEYPGVFPVYMNITNPLDTSAIPKKVVAALKKAAKQNPDPEYTGGVDGWDKRGPRGSGEHWFPYFAQGLKDGNTLAWTVVPDWVTETLKALGYDGIKDTGGKQGGAAHEVWIPFEENQVKSVFNQNPTSDPRILMQSGAAPFFSPTARFVEAIQVKKPQPAKFWIDQLYKGKDPKPGLRPEELEDLGLREWLEGQQGVVSKEQVLQFIADGGPKLEEVVKGGGESLTEVELERIAELEEMDLDPADQEYYELADLQARRDEGRQEGGTKFGQYQLPGGENYREVLVTVPGNDRTEADKAARAVEEAQTRYEQDGSQANYAALVAARDAAKKFGAGWKSNDFTSSHWSEPNVLAHYRLNDRTDADGKRVLFIEEIQSDWHQAGRKKGYGPERTTTVEREVSSLPKSEQQVFAGSKTVYEVLGSDGRRLYIGRDKAKTERAAQPNVRKGVPNAPFKKSWPMLAFKRVLREAVEKGYDSVAWTTGEQQAERYDLSKSISLVVYRPETKNLRAYDLNEKRVMDDTVEPANIEDHIGKEAAQKLLQTERDSFGEHQLSGLDLKVGGEGMKGFYDKMLPKMVQDYVKKLDPSVKVGAAAVDAGGSEYKVERSGSSFRLRREGSIVGVFPSADAAWAEAERLGTTSVHSLDITPAMREAITQNGQALYQPLASDVNMGAVTFSTPSGKPVIDLFTKANASTFLHESGHIYFEAVKQMAAAPDAPPQIREIWAAAKAGLYKLADSAATRAGQRTDLAPITGDDVRALLDADLKGTTRKNRAAYIGLQEEWARQIEAYFMEGKTPNLELRSVFQKFKDWLRAIYENFSALGMAEPSAELKPVFDRIFATDQQIAEAEGFYLATKPFLDQGFEMAEEDRKAYLARVNKAKETANDARMRKLAKAYIQALGGKDEFTKAATEEINASPIYRAMDEILAEGGYSREAVEAIVGKEAATALSKRRRGLVTKDGAEPVLRPGFDSLPAMLNALMAAPTKKDAIKNLTETKIAQERKFLEQMIHDDNVLPGDEDYHNDDRLALLHAEFILLSKQVKGRELAARMKDAQLEVAAVREAARQAIAKMTTSTATSPSKFARQERKAAKEAFLAKAKGDMAAMAEAKRKEMLNHALFMEAAIAREQMEKLERGARRLVNSKSMKRESRALAERLAIQFGLHRPTKQRTVSAEWADYKARLAVEEKDVPTVMVWSEAMYELGYDVAFDPFILTTQEPLDYKTLTWGQVLAVREALNIIRTIDKNERTVFLNGQRIALEEMRAQLAAGLDPVLTKEKPAPKPGSPYIDKPGIKGLVKGIHANHLKLEAILQRLDGWKTGGIWWNTFLRPVAGAEDARSLRLKQVAADLKEMFALYAKKKGDLFNKQILIPALGRSFTKSQLLAVALNTGNEGNLLRLAKGEGWTVLDQNGRDAADMQKIMAVLQPLEKQDWDFVQKVWNYLDTFRPEAFQLEERLTGKMPERVEAKPVETPFGQYAGGYYPAVYDADRSYTTFSRKQAEDDKSLFGRNHGSSQTKHNHLKARAQSGGDQKVSLDLGVLSEHLFTVVHDITHREPLLEVAKLVRDKEISKMIEDALGKEVYREFMPWLQDIARERMVPPFTRLERLAAWARKGTTMMSLGLKMTTIITQPFGLTQTFEALGPAYTMRGISTVYRNLPDMYRTITEKSVFMANRLENFDREVRDSMKGVTGFQDKKKAVEKFAYYGIGMAQMGVDLPTWWGGYQKGLAEFNGDEAKAVAYADSVVRLSQSSGATKDLSRVQRGPELQRMFTMFYSYFNMLYNLAYRAGTRYRGDHNIPRAAASALLLWFLPAILTELATGRGPDDDEGEEWMSWAGTKLALYPLNMIVGLRDLTNAIGSGFDYQTTPAAGAPASIVKWAKAVNAALEEEEPERLIKPTVEMIGFAAHLPLKQVEITVGNVWDYVTGEDPDLQVRDLFFNKPKSRR